MKNKKKQPIKQRQVPTITYQELIRRNPDRPANNPLYPELLVKERAYETPQDMAQRILNYFDWCAEYTEEVMSASGQIKEITRPLVPTVEELCSFLGVSFRTLSNYENRPGFDFVVQQAKEFIKGRKMSALINGKGSSAGLIFDLTNNFGMKHSFESREERTLRVVYEDDTAKAALPKPEADAGSVDQA